MCATTTRSITKVDVDVGGASNPNTESKAVKRRRAYPRRGGNTCRHYCSHHQEVMDNVLWRKLPRELVERVCAALPLSKTIELQKLCKPWSRMPTATNFRQSCAQAHPKLFGILMHNDFTRLYRLAVSNSQHDDWRHIEVNDFSVHLESWNKALFGHDGGLISFLPNSFEAWNEPPSICVFNPLTGDKKDIILSSFTTSRNDIKVILLQLIMDAETGCYKLILVTQSAQCRGAEVLYFPESYDSKSGLWSALDSGFVYGDGVIKNERCQVYFDCSSKQFCRPDGQPAENGVLVRRPHFFTFVKDHRFELNFILVQGQYRDYRLLEMSESVWHNSWDARSTTRFAMELPSKGFETRLLACQRYLLVVADDASSYAFKHRHQRMILYDRDTCKETYDIPGFWTEEFNGDAKFIDNLHFMCDLKWNAVP